MRTCKLQLIVALANNKNDPSREIIRTCTTTQSTHQLYTLHNAVYFCFNLWGLGTVHNMYEPGDMELPNRDDLVNSIIWVASRCLYN